MTPAGKRATASSKKYFSNSTSRVESLSPTDKRSIFASAIEFADMNFVRLQCDLNVIELGSVAPRYAIHCQRALVSTIETLLKHLVAKPAQRERTAS
jgi:hypothetical protein